MNYGKLLTLLVMAFTLSGSMNAEDLTLKITKKYLNLPVSHQKERAVMTLSVLLISDWHRESRITGCFVMYLLSRGSR